MLTRSQIHRASLPSLAVLAACWSLGGCTIGGSRGVGVENNRLRDELAAANKKIESLSAERDELTTKLSQQRGDVPPDVLAATPALASIGIGSLSGLVPADPATAKRVDVYIAPIDGRQRFVQIVGTMQIDAVLEAADTDASNSVATVPLASATLTPTQVRDAYRSGFTGTHYTVELPLNTPTPAALARRQGSLVLRARFVDAWSGRTFTCESRLELSTPAKK
ncbi:MAG: hypothetical protein SFY96_08550 [Planctomycetota bacterium]|nr:hypothetical protein [Planctomycetota bacterium]